MNRVKRAKTWEHMIPFRHTQTARNDTRICTHIATWRNIWKGNMSLECNKKPDTLIWFEKFLLRASYVHLSTYPIDLLFKFHVTLSSSLL